MAARPERELHARSTAETAPLPVAGAAPVRPVGAPTVAAPDRERRTTLRAGGLDWISALAVMLLTISMHGFRLSIAPDLLADEGLYGSVARNVANGAGLTYDDDVFMWHPPLFMLLEAAYLRATGLANADILTVLLSGRWVNVAISGMTAALLVLFGQKLHSNKAGILMAALFMLDPYVQRINRRGMLETGAMFFALLALYFFFTRGRKVPFWRQLAAGVAFGLAMLTKELMAIVLLAVVGYALWARRSQLGDALRVAGIALLTYSVYPVWAFAVGEGERFLTYKLFGVGRFLNIYQLTDIQPPRGWAFIPGAGRPPLLENLGVLLGQYASSYVLLALGGLLTLVILWRYRHLLEARYLVAWSVVSYAAIGFSLLGGTSDQFAYFLVVPAVVMVGAAVATLMEPAVERVSVRAARAARAQGIAIIGPDGSVTEDEPAPRSAGRRPWLALAVPLLLALSLYNGFQWFTHYLAGRDNSYTQIYHAVRERVPAGQTIVVGSDLSNYLFEPDYQIVFYRDRASVLQENVRYFILSSKEPWGRYNAVTPEFYQWVLSTSRPLYVGEGNTFWRLGLYERTGE